MLCYRLNPIYAKMFKVPMIFLHGNVTILIMVTIHRGFIHEKRTERFISCYTAAPMTRVTYVCI